jgi:hypothetical protein
MMPIFYDHMFVELFLARIEADVSGKAKEWATEAVIKNKAVAKLIGVFIGKIGEEPMKRMLEGMSKIIRDVVLKVADHVISNGPNSLTEAQIEQLCTHHLVPMYSSLSRVPLRMDRAKEILRETARNAAAAKTRLQKIAKAVDAVAG